MALGKEQVQALNEAELRLKVLIPLFRAMGFRDVFHYHGGALEHGKDIVMWKPDELGERINYGVVVKATKLSGKVSGPSTAGEVLTQIQQCLNNPFKDPVTADDKKVQRCWVVSSYEITKEAIAAISGSLNAFGADKVTTFVDGDRLWELIDKHLGEATVVEKLRHVQAILDEMSEHHRVVASTASGKVTLFLEPKYPGAEEVEPITFSGTLVFPNTPEGEAMRIAWENHLNTGAPVSFTKPFLKDFSVPAFLRPLLNPLDEEVGELVFGPRRSEHPISARVHITNGDATRTISGLEFYGVQLGNEQKTLDNHHQNSPWKLRATLNFTTQRVDLNFAVTYTGLTAVRALENVRFQNALSEGGIFRLEHLDTGFDIVKSEIMPNKFPEVDPEWVTLLEALAFIQIQTQTAIVIPESNISEEDFENALSIVEKLRTGQAILRDASVTFRLDRDSARRLIERIERKGHISISWISDAVESTFGTEIKMGPAQISCVRAMIGIADIGLAKRQLADEQCCEVSLTLVPAEDESFKVKYYKWLPEAEVRLLPSLPAQIEQNGELTVGDT